MTARALYVYAIVPGATRLGEVWGIGNEPVEIVAEAGMGIVVSDVDVRLLEDVNEATDAASLGSLAERHHAVVREAAGAATGLLPFRLGTLVADRESARRYLTDSVEELAPALRRVDACREWGVTVREGAGKSASGGARAGAEVHAELSARAVDATTGRPRRDDVLFFNNYLVRQEAEAAFFEAVERCGDRLLESGLHLELSGPWPPYSFAPGRLEESEAE